MTPQSGSTMVKMHLDSESVSYRGPGKGTLPELHCQPLGELEEALPETSHQPLQLNVANKQLISRILGD